MIQPAKDCRRPGMKLWPKYIPPDIRKIVIRKQAKMMDEASGVRSQEAAIYAIIREWDEMKNKT